MRQTKNQPTVLYGFGDGEAEFQKGLAKSQLSSRLGSDEKPTLAKSILNVLNNQDGYVSRLAFESDPSQVNNFAGVYHAKLRLVPDSVLKRISIQDSLVAAIVRARQNHVSSFGRPRPDRFSKGFIVKPNTGILDKLDAKGKAEFSKQVERAIKLLSTCGHTDGVPTEHQKTFAEYLGLTARSGVVCGRFATEIVQTEEDGEKKFSHFVAADAGTIYRATTDKTGQESIRKDAYHLLCKLTGKKLVKEHWNNDEYAWVQVIDGTPKQVFTAEEMKVYNVYPVPDVELDGYPVTPIDTCITAITTHVNIVTHNKMYFQSGRAARGMLVLKSDNVTPAMLNNIKQNFNASINSVGNAWRMPVFGVPTDGAIDWQPIDSGGGRDMEFQYLSDMNCREILTAFMMSPDELPGYSYLSRGTASQALSECVAPSSRILTPNGLVSVADVVGDGNEVKTKVWTGKEWVDGRVFKSGEKSLQETELTCGIKLQTSPDHRYKVVNEDGSVEWKHQSELLVGDRVLVNKKPIDGIDSLVPAYKGKKLTLEMMETLGWLTGDGSLVAPKSRSGAYLKFFYHQEKERDIWEHHKEVLEGFGLEVKHNEKLVSAEEQESLKNQYGFKFVAPSRITNTVYDTDFFRWLLSWGFTASGGRSKGNGKNIPAILHVLPKEYRAAFLRGLFSADGHVTKKGYICLTIQATELREQVRQLLMGLGIRALGCKGLNRESFGGGKRFSYKIFIKDRDAFWDTVGFIQKHKSERRNKALWIADAPPLGMVQKWLGECIKSSVFKSLDKGLKDTVVSYCKTGKCSYQFLSREALRCGVTIPDWSNEYYAERVVSLRDLKQSVSMYDVEIYDDSHSFVVEGVITHNSNQEYVLLASRDVGIRPLLSSIEDFINADLLPLIDSDLAKKATVCLVGLDANTQEKEAVQLQTSAQVYLTFDDILQKVEKEVVGKEWAGQIPLNPIYKTYIDQYFTVGQILEKFCGIEGASKDPSLAYIPHPYWFQWQQLRMQQQQMQQQAQAQQQQQQSQGSAPQQGGNAQQGAPEEQPAPSRANPQDDATEKQRTQEQEQPKAGAGQLGKAIEQAYDLMQKSENNLPADKRRVLAQHKKTVDHFVHGFNTDAKAGIKEILDIARQLSPRK